MKKLEFHKRIKKIMKTIELQMRIIEIIKILEFHTRIFKIMKINEFSIKNIKFWKSCNSNLESQQNNENPRIPFENPENYEKSWISKRKSCVKRIIQMHIEIDWRPRVCATNTTKRRRILPKCATFNNERIISDASSTWLSIAKRCSRSCTRTDSQFEELLFTYRRKFCITF